MIFYLLSILAVCFSALIAICFWEKVFILERRISEVTSEHQDFMAHNILSFSQSKRLINTLTDKLGIEADSISEAESFVFQCLQDSIDETYPRARKEYEKKKHNAKVRSEIGRLRKQIKT